MAAYAAMVSLGHTIEQLQNHPRPPITLDKSQIESLTEKVNFFQDFLENYSVDADGLESRIADAAHEAEDAIESHIFDRIQAWGQNLSSNNDSLVQGLREAIESMNSIAKDVEETREKAGIRKHQPRLNSATSAAAGSSRYPPMVGLADVMIDVKDKLTNQPSSREVIQVAGMGGMGKTTLAWNIYTDPLIRQHFDILAWATVSQDYCLREILLEFLVSIVHHQVSKEIFEGKSDDALGILLYKRLWGRRYLMVMDDIWSREAWEEIKFFFPENNNGSRVMVTTRLSREAFRLSDSRCIEMRFLSNNESWNLLQETVFGKESHPGFELEEIGRKIAENCRGLPLSIVVIGGLLAKSEATKSFWEHVAENLNSILNSGDNESCFKILQMSYRHLPVYLKPCFLYMGAFQEDAKIRVSSLVKLWVSEGFLKPIGGKSSELVARCYLKELVDRNLVSVHKLGPTRNIKICKCHDLLRELSIKEARKERFMNLLKLGDISTDTSNSRRICYPQSIRRHSFSTYDLARPEIPNPEAKALLSSPQARSLLCDSPLLLPFLGSKLLRVFKADDCLPLPFSDSPKDIFGLVNSRLVDVRVNWYQIPATDLSSLHLFWNLQTLILEGPNVSFPREFWTMTQLRHIRVRRLELPDPSGIDLIVLANLQTLKTVCNLEFSKEMVKRIPAIKKVALLNSNRSNGAWFLGNLGHLHELESLRCVSYRKFSFPIQLKKLTLEGNDLRWEDAMMERIGSLPRLEVLELKKGSFVGPRWETVEGQFGSLKFLLIEHCLDLECWETESDHFPRLECLVLRYLGRLGEIPPGIGYIPTLKSIEVEYCCDSAGVSATRILEEQKEMGNEDLRVTVRVQPWEKLGKS